MSLRIQWYADDEGRLVRARVTVPPTHQSYPGVVHGGVVAALLDETAGRATMLGGAFDNLFVTVKLEVTFRRPTPTGVELELVGRVLEPGSKRSRVGAEIRLPDGTLSASCEAVVVRPPETIREGWEAERDHWRVDDEPLAPPPRQA